MDRPMTITPDKAALLVELDNEGQLPWDEWLSDIQYLQRARDMLALRAQGKPYSEIGALVEPHISRERVRYIFYTVATLVLREADDLTEYRSRDLSGAARALQARHALSFRVEPLVRGALRAYYEPAKGLPPYPVPEETLTRGGEDTVNARRPLLTGAALLRQVYRFSRSDAARILELTEERMDFYDVDRLISPHNWRLAYEWHVRTFKGRDGNNYQENSQACNWPAADMIAGDVQQLRLRIAERDQALPRLDSSPKGPPHLTAAGLDIPARRALVLARGEPQGNAPCETDRGTARGGR